MTRNKDRRLPEGDDGRTIVNMNVEGMPWYSPEGQESRSRHRRHRGQSGGTEEKMSARQARIYTWGALKAGLLVIGVFCLGMVLFVLFCLYVWFRV